VDNRVYGSPVHAEPAIYQELSAAQPRGVEE